MIATVQAESVSPGLPTSKPESAERIFKPLKMQDTHFFLDDTQGGRLMSQYTPGDDLTITLQDPGDESSRWIVGYTGGNKKVFRGAGGLVSTAHDYVRFQQAMLNGGELEGKRLLSPSTVGLMMDNHTGDLPLWLPGPGMGFGLGWAVVEDRREAATPCQKEVPIGVAPIALLPGSTERKA